jgi:Tol biopolymer transport system component
MVTSIDAAPLVSADSLAFSPNLEFAAYPQLRQPEGVSPEQAESWLEVLRLANGDRQAYPYAITRFRWAPDSRRFAFLVDRYQSQLYVGQWSGETVRGSVDPGTPVYDVRWVDAEHYLFVSRRTLEGDQVSWDLVLADIQGSSTILASLDSYPHYDFAIVTPVTQTEPGTTPTPDISATPTRVLPTQTPVAPFPGLVYWEENGLWLDLGAEQVRISDRPDVRLSPDGNRFVYQDRGEAGLDIWLGDRITARRLNLTKTPGRTESDPRWWPARPDTIVFGSQLQDSQADPGTGAFLTVVNLDGSAYRVLDEKNPVGCAPAPSPDGRTIAYGSGRTAWIFNMDTGPEVFDQADYGLDVGGELSIGSPAWSPDGTKLAWVLVGNLAGDDSLRYGIGVFDQQSRTVEVLGSFQPESDELCPPAPVWSPDGHWLAFEVWAASFDELGLWVAHLERAEQEAYHLGGGQPVWSPDGQWLALRGRESGHWLVQPGSWNPLALDLPPDVDLVDWIDPFEW